MTKDDGDDGDGDCSCFQFLRHLGEDTGGDPMTPVSRLVTYTVSVIHHCELIIRHIFILPVGPMSIGSQYSYTGIQIYNYESWEKARGN